MVKLRSLMANLVGEQLKERRKQEKYAYERWAKHLDLLSLSGCPVSSMGNARRDPAVVQIKANETDDLDPR